MDPRGSYDTSGVFYDLALRYLDVSGIQLIDEWQVGYRYHHRYVTFYQVRLNGSPRHTVDLVKTTSQNQDVYLLKTAQFEQTQDLFVGQGQGP